MPFPVFHFTCGTAGLHPPLQGSEYFLGGHPALAALTATCLFGIGSPLSKLLLAEVSPWLLAALLYLGSGLGLWLMRQIRRTAKLAAMKFLNTLFCSADSSLQVAVSLL